ncbi:unnamed protein product, partial [Rotaria magnacalcarata]
MLHVSELAEQRRMNNKSKSSPCIACSSSMATNRMIAEERESRCLVQ